MINLTVIVLLISDNDDTNSLHRTLQGMIYIIAVLIAVYGI